MIIVILMRFDRAGLPFVMLFLLPAIYLFLNNWTVSGTVMLVAGTLCALFFRDPKRNPPNDTNVAVAPADGRVIHAGEGEPGICPEGLWYQVSVFLSPLNVHVNRCPVGGSVVEVSYQAGKKLAAFSKRSAAENERSEITIDHNGKLVIFRQVVGLLARRVVCRISPGMTVAQGQRFGIMKFGSRMDVFVPRSSTLLVSVGDLVVGGETVIARLNEEQ